MKQKKNQWKEILEEKNFAIRAGVVAQVVDQRLSVQEFRVQIQVHNLALWD